MLDQDGIRERRALIRRARTELGERDRAAANVEILQAQVDDEPAADTQVTTSSSVTITRVVSVSLAVSGVAALIFGFLIGNQAIGLGLLAGAIMLAGAFILILGSRRMATTQVAESPAFARLRRQIDEEEKRLSRFQTTLSELASQLDIESPDAEALIAAEDALDTAQAALAERNRLAEVLRGAEETLEQRKARRVELAASVKSIRGALESAESDWRAWLTQRSLLDSFSPENIEVLRGLVDLGRTRHADVTSMEQRIAAIRTDIQEFLDILTPLSVAHGFELLPDDHPRAAAVADDLIELHQQVSDQSRAKADAQNDLRAARKDLKERERNLKKIQQEIDDLLNAAGAQDADDFHRRADIHAERQKLKRKHRHRPRPAPAHQRPRRRAQRPAGGACSIEPADHSRRHPQSRAGTGRGQRADRSDGKRAYHHPELSRQPAQRGKLLQAPRRTP